MATTKKFNEWQLNLIEKGLELVKLDVMLKIENAKAQGKMHWFHPNFVDLTIAETLEIAKSLTQKPKK